MERRGSASEVVRLEREIDSLRAQVERARAGERKWRDHYHKLCQSLAAAVVDLELADVEETRDGAHVTFGFAKEARADV